MIPETPTERVALVVWYLAIGVGLTTKEIAQIVNMKPDSALRMMYRITRVLPVYQDETDIWRKCDAVSDSVSYVV